jgi:hypothetical protein
MKVQDSFGPEFPHVEGKAGVWITFSCHKPSIVQPILYTAPSHKSSPMHASICLARYVNSRLTGPFVVINFLI